MAGKSGIAPEVVPALPRADGNSVRGGEGKFSAKLGDGSFSYRLPLLSPQGRGGSQPNLELVYRLRSHGNGAFGTGWNIEIPSIRRRTDFGIPRFNGSDTFVMGNGQRIVRVGDGEFRSLVEKEFRRILFNGNYWEITEGDGTRINLGESDESRVFDPAIPSHVFEWKVSRVEDTNGNITRYRYMRDLDVKYPEGYTSAQVYLSAIQYTNLPGGDFLNSIIFLYRNERADAWTNFRPGFPIRTRYYCTDIISYAGNMNSEGTRVINFDGVPLGLGETERTFVRYGLLISWPGNMRIRMDFPMPLSAVKLLMNTNDGRKYQIRETDCTGSVTERTVIGVGNTYDLILGAGVLSVEIETEEGALLKIRNVRIPGTRLPVVHSRYRLRYHPTVVTSANVSIDNLPPATLHLQSVQRFGYDTAFNEQNLPPVRFEYRALNLTGLTPLIVQGSPKEPLGTPDTSLLNFAGKGKPDLIQTMESHRVFFNRGRQYPLIQLEGRQFSESPSATLRQPDVFLRDVRGLGAVDLTTTEYYYLNPSGDGPVSETTPAWSGAKAYDQVHRHPELSTEQLAISRSIDLNGDGIPDLLSTDNQFLHWLNLGEGTWSAPTATNRISSFGDTRFPNISFDDPHIFINDINGDGLDEIIRVEKRKVEYWTPVQGKWPYIKTTMVNSPRLHDFDPKRVVLADITGNGAVDLLYVHGNSVEVFINVGGSTYSEGFIIDFTDFGVSHGLPMPNDAISLAGADFLGDGVPGILWSAQRQDIEPNYFFLPLSRYGKPFLLTRIENGIGGRMDLDYSTSAFLAAEDRNLGKPWNVEPPYPVIVLTMVVETDLVIGTTIASKYRYREGYYDRRVREFLGFQEVEERRLPAPKAIEGLIIRHYYFNGISQNDTCEEKVRARALAGLELRTQYHRMDNDMTLREIHRSYETETVYQWEVGAGGIRIPTSSLKGTKPDELVLFPYLRQVVQVDIEGGTSPRYSAIDYRYRIPTDQGEVIEEFGRLQSEIFYGEVVSSGSGFGAIATIISGGLTVPLRPANDPSRHRKDYEYATNIPAHIFLNCSRVITWTGDTFNRLVAEDRFYYDGGANKDDFLPLGKVEQGNLQRKEVLFAKMALLTSLFGAGILNSVGADENSGPGFFMRARCEDGETGFFSIPERHTYHRAGGRILYGARSADYDARGACTTRMFDAAFWQVIKLTNELGHAHTYKKIDYRTGLPVQVLDENKVWTKNSYDSFGRILSTTEDSGTFADPQKKWTYDDDSFVVNGTPTSVRSTELIDHAELPKRFVTTLSYRDGLGREIRAAKSSESNGNAFVAMAYLFEAGGNKPSWKSLPFWSIDPLNANLNGLEGTTILRDPLSRDIRVEKPDGQITQTEYQPWKAIISDPEDLNSNSEHFGTPKEVLYDAFGRPIAVKETVKNGAGNGSIEMCLTKFNFDYKGCVTSLIDPKGYPVKYEYSSTKCVLKVIHPDAGTIIRLYDAANKEIYRCDATGNQRWFLYDALGRIAKEVAGADPAGMPSVVYQYDNAVANGVGRLTSVMNTEEDHTITYTYDRRGHIASSRYVIASIDQGTDVSEYNSIGEIKRRVFHDGSTLTYQIGLDGKPNGSKFKPGAGGADVPIVESVKYDLSGSIAKATLCGGTVEFEADYHPLTFRLLRRAYRGIGGVTLLDINITSYDSVGNIGSYTEVLDQSVTIDWRLLYDSLYRLRQADARSAGRNVVQFAYTYDVFGNMIRNDESAPGTIFEYNELDKPNAVRGTTANPNAYDYDASGRIIASMLITKIVWSNLGRIRELENVRGDRVKFTYTHQGRLLALALSKPGSTVSTTICVSDDREIGPAGERYFALFGGEQFVGVNSAGVCSVPIRSVASNVVANGDQAGRIIPTSIERFTPYGSTIGAMPTSLQRHGYADAIRVLTGVYSMGIRGFIAGLGRFLSTDPMLEGHFTERMLLEPQRLNPYSYALGNPLRFRDRTGLQPAHNPPVVSQGASRAEQSVILSAYQQPIYETLDVGKRTPMRVETGDYNVDRIIWALKGLDKVEEMRAFLKDKFGQGKDLSASGIIRNTGEHPIYRKMDVSPRGTTSWEELAAAAIRAGFWVHAEGVTLGGKYYPFSPLAIQYGSHPHLDLYLIKTVKMDVGDFPQSTPDQG